MLHVVLSLRTGVNLSVIVRNIVVKEDWDMKCQNTHLLVADSEWLQPYPLPFNA